MDITTLTSSDLRKIEALLKTKEKLLAQVDAINEELRGFGGNGSSRPTKSAGRPPKATKTPRGKRGKVKAQVIAELQAAGKTGIHVKDLAKKIGVKVPNLSVWFFSTGKKIKEIKKTAPATYAWVA